MKYAPIIAVVDEWWGGRAMAPLLPKLVSRTAQTDRPSPKSCGLNANEIHEGVGLPASSPIPP